MRVVFRVLILLACVVTCDAADAISFVRVWAGWKNAESFDSISEYFTGREEHGHRVVLRTTPDARAGFYFLVRVKNSGPAMVGAKFVLQVISPSSPETKTHTFAIAVPSGATVYQLGLTGAEWPDRKAHPVAWKLDLMSTDTQVLTSEQSFLWSKPAP